MKKTLTALLVAAACGAAFAQAAQLDKKDREFIEKAAAGGMLEVEAGKMAESKSQNADVKSFGNMLATDHAAANDELKALAQKKGVTVPASLPKKEQKMLDKMAGAKNFDKEFIHDGVQDHKKDIKEFEKASKEAKDPDVKAFAAKTLPTLQKHLEKAEAIEKDLKARKA